jgi:hypothetical protein
MGGRTQEKHKDLVWFGLLERNTLRPLWCLYCLRKPGSGLVNLRSVRLRCVCPNECILPFIVQGRCLHCAGPRQVAPANRSLLYEI